jgi:hypothetical protein
MREKMEAVTYTHIIYTHTHHVLTVQQNLERDNLASTKEQISVLC